MLVAPFLVSSLLSFIAWQEPDDALPRDRRALVAELTDRDMPELVEELLASAPAAHHIYVARAYAKATSGATSASEREQFVNKATDEYRRAIGLGEESTWLRGLRRRYDVAAWQVEWADFVLRQKAAPDLDRYEITSGLDFDQRRVVELLREAHAAYTQAGARLDEQLVGLRTQEQEYLLLGLADKITRLADQRRLNAAWAAVYLAMTGDDKLRRQSLLDAALSDFDSIARTARDAERKYNALVGAGIALRESGRYAEATSALDRVRLSTASQGLIVRARYEQARTHIAAKQFDEARRELTELERTTSDDAADSAGFYHRLAPVIAAYSYLEEAKSPGRNAANQAALRTRAIEAFNEIAKRGGPWTEIAQVYLTALQGPQRKLEELGDVELTLTAARWMKEEKYDKAIAPLKLLLDRPAAKSDRRETTFNLAVCQLQTGDLQTAADRFDELAKTPGNLTERAAVYAYQSRRQLANDKKTVAHYERLAHSAAHLAERFPDNALADEARWISALAYQESGQWTTAGLAYSKIPTTSLHFREAQRAIAVCRQRLYQELPPDAPRDRRQKAARSAADAWQSVAKNTGDAPSTIESAHLAAVELLAGPDLQAFDEAMAILRAMPPTDRVVLLRLRCLRSMGDEKSARRELDDLVQTTAGPQRARVLTALALQLEEEARRLDTARRTDEAKRAWTECVGVLRELLQVLRDQPAMEDQILAARSSLAAALASSGDPDAARTEYERLISDDSTNGAHLRDAALLEEESSRQTNPPVAAAADRAEAHWSKLLEDASLRERSPSIYWEARYHWLAHQLRHGRAAEVSKGIEAEKAWYPDLGGPPWQGRLLELADKARGGGHENP